MNKDQQDSAAFAAILAIGFAVVGGSAIFFMKFLVSYDLLIERMCLGC